MSTKRRELTDKEKFCIVGYLGTKDANMAYILSRDTPPTDNEASRKVQVSRWLNSRAVSEFIETRQRATCQQSKEERTDTENRKREDAVAELNALIDAAPDAKTKGDLLLKLADLQRWKQAELTEEDKHVTFYIPLTIDRAIETIAYWLKEHFGQSDEWMDEAIAVMKQVPDLRGYVENRPAFRPGKN